MHVSMHEQVGLALQKPVILVTVPSIAFSSFQSKTFLQAAALVLQKVPQCNSSRTDDYIR